MASGADHIRQHGSLDIPEERAFIEQTSPYQNLRQCKPFPLPLIATSEQHALWEALVCTYLAQRLL